MLRTSTLQIAGAAGKQALRPLPHLQQRFTQTRPGQPKNLVSASMAWAALKHCHRKRLLDAWLIGANSTLAICHSQFMRASASKVARRRASPVQPHASPSQAASLLLVTQSP